ncbi:MAG: HlyD family efflux transporter periplasmic adaptor subunit [Deltaproteobacteria bacterium]|nr:HlyD family efflux transporter periplasmic adaptor subunit [Deltaproteobacteria bacterium]
MRIVAGLLGVLAVAGCGGRSTVPPGYQGVVEYEERTLAFELSGRVTKVAVRRGDVVADGAVLVEIDDTLEKLGRASRADDAEGARADLALLQAGAKREDLAALSAQVKAAEATLALLQKNAERARALRASGSVAQAEVDRAESETERMSAEVRSLQQRLASLQRGARTEELDRARARVGATSDAIALVDERIARHTLRAKGPGDVLDVHVETGELALGGAPVVTIADTTHPYVDVFVPQGEMAGMHVGLKASIKVDALSEPLTGAVESVGRRTEFTPKYVFSERERPNLVVRVRVRVDDPGKKMIAGVPAFVTVSR